MSRACSLLEIPAPWPWLNVTKINSTILFIYAGIPGGNFQVITLAGRMKAKNRTAGNTPFMRFASPAHVIRPLL